MSLFQFFLPDDHLIGVFVLFRGSWGLLRVASGTRGTWRPAALTLAPIEFVVTRASTVQCFRPGGEYR